jgi:hypothetical protein
MSANGWYESMAEEDFARARTRELLSRISALLDPERNRLLSLGEVVAILKPSGETYVGMKAVDIDKIVGSEGRYRDFNRHFLPRREHLRSRWVSVDMAHYEDVPLPPVRLYEIGGLFFVRDGNHRVSVAKLRGQTSIDAEVTTIDAEVALRPGMTLEELKGEVIGYEKRRFYERTNYGAVTGDEHLDFTSPGRYDEILEHILVHKYYLNQSLTRELGLGQAIWSWHENVYGPIVLAIEEEGLLSRFPGRTPSDLYVFIVKHWDELKRKYGLEYPISDAARDFGERFGTTRTRRLARLLVGLLRKTLAIAEKKLVVTRTRRKR